MSRPREFNEQEALDRAMEVFWRCGYQKASTEDLMQAMGIQRGSFYNTFGSKRETYIRALERYRELLSHDGGPYAAPPGTRTGIDMLQEVLGAYLGRVFDKDRPPGCFFLHVSEEHRGGDAEITEAVMKGVQQMREFIATQVEAAQQSGELPDSLEPQDAALMFMAVAWGLNVMAEAGVAERDIKAAAGQLFSLTRPSA